MKKKLAMLTVAVAVICGLVAVGPAGNPVALAEEEDALLQAIGEITAELEEVNSTLKGLVPGPEEPEPPIEWIGQSLLGGESLGFESLQTMCDDIFAASGESLVLDLRPGGELCPPNEQFQAVDQGDIDFAVTNPHYFAGGFPSAGLFSARPGGMSPMEQYLWLVSGGGAELAQDMVDGSNVYIIPGGGQVSTPETFLWSNRQITGLADLTEPNPLVVRSVADSGAILERMGVDVVMYSGAELYEAMRRGVIDACELGSPCSDWSLRLHEVSQYMYVSECRAPHSYFPLLVNEDSWNELPDDLRVIVEKLAREQATKSYAELCQCDIEALENILDYGGCTVKKLPKEVRDAFLLEAEAFYDEKAVEHPGLYAEVLDSQREFQKTFRKVWPRP